MMLITADLIPHNQFHQGSWLIPVTNPVWYYFAKQENCNHVVTKKILNFDLLETVDEPIREMVQFLQDHGIMTTPSCSGHFKCLSEFEKVYDALEEDLYHIRNGGLELKDIETAKTHIYHDPNYNLPWNRTSFLEQIYPYHHKGVLGMRIDDPKLEKQILDLHVEKMQISKNDGVILMQIETEDPEENLRSWKTVTLAIQDLMRKGLTTNSNAGSAVMA